MSYNDLLKAISKLTPAQRKQPVTFLADMEKMGVECFYACSGLDLDKSRLLTDDDKPSVVILGDFEGTEEYQ